MQYSLYQHQLMRERMRHFEEYCARKQPPLSYGDALGAACLANAQAWGLSLDETIDLLSSVSSTLSPAERRAIGWRHA